MRYELGPEPRNALTDMDVLLQFDILTFISCYQLLEALIRENGFPSSFQLQPEQTYKYDTFEEF